MRRQMTVPTHELADAERTAAATFPGAHVTALWTPGCAHADVCVEIRPAGPRTRAHVVPWANGRPATC